MTRALPDQFKQKESHSILAFFASKEIWMQSSLVDVLG